MDFELMLSDFGWSTDVLKPKQLANLENSIRREQGRVEAGSWLSHADAAREERVAHVETLLDKAIAECDELEGLLTLYHVELSSLNDDIAFIEAQSQGLQVQSANQKLLQSELQGIVDTMSLDRRVMEPLRYGDLSEPAGLEEVENSLVRLYQAMLTLDPSMRSTHSRPRSRSGLADNETSSMVALREKKAIYDRETSEFCQRLMKFLDSKFMTSMNSVKGRVLRQAGTGGLAKLQPEAFNEARSALWMYGPLLLFTKELNPPAWNTLLRMYPQRANPLYKDSFRDNIQNWKRAARPSSGDELDVLFTTQEKEDPATGGLTSTARKLTVKRSQTLAKSLRGATGDRHGALELKQPGAMIKALSFAGALDEMAPLVSREQNFVVDLFHASSLETTDFIDAVQSMPPGGRRGTNLLERKPVEPDRALSGLVTKAMLTIFDFFLADLKAMQDWAFTDDPIQGVGVMTTLCRHMYFLQDSSQDYLLQLLDNLADSLKTRFVKFVDEQVRAIEDTKVKIKKRKGVIAFMKIFPHFSAAIENVYSAVAGNDYDGPAPSVMEVRKLVDDAYEKINRAMFDSLKVIAKESPGLAVQSGKPTHGTADDPEDKEMLNYHILLIENMNHYVEEVDDGGKAGVLADWKGRAMKERAEALDAYVGRVIRRPLGKLLVRRLPLSPPLVNIPATNRPHRISSTPPNPSYRTRRATRPRSWPGRRSRARRSAPCSRPTTAAKSAAASTRCGSASRNTLARPMRSSCRAAWSRWCARGASGATSASWSAWSAWSRTSIPPPRARRMSSSTSPSRMYRPVSGDDDPGRRRRRALSTRHFFFFGRYLDIHERGGGSGRMWITIFEGAEIVVFFFIFFSRSVHAPTLCFLVMVLFSLVREVYMCMWLRALV
jgi:hypothetical protein